MGGSQANGSGGGQADRIAARVASLPSSTREGEARALCGGDEQLLAEVRRLLSERPAGGPGESAPPTLIAADVTLAVGLGDRSAVAGGGSGARAEPGGGGRVGAPDATFIGPGAGPPQGPDRQALTFGASAAPREAAGSLTERAVPSPGYDLEAPVMEGPGSQIGPYRLEKVLGEGGFGSVFLAEQQRPVQRKVALKVIKLGMDTRQVVARFEAERQALALMDHPSIAKVFDAGATSAGRPYFVMELCRGEPMTDFCDRQKLAIRARLELFAQVCDAVQHAHQKGIIHRDIKPSNILVSEGDDGRPLPKVIDFGIAKATGSKLADQTVMTEQSQMIGTPQYMSPEQAQGSVDIDTRTDVYSLGVLLYELLIGVTPFDVRQLRGAGLAEIQRLITEVEPPKPSTRLTQSTDTVATVAATRQIEPLKLGTLIRGELDWIVMRAIEKDRARRYETANALRMDVRRYLAGEAVQAVPPSRLYLTRKLVRRNKGPVAAAVAVAVVLVGGLVGTSYGLRQAIFAREAEAEAKQGAQREAQRALHAEAEAKQRASELKLVSDFQAGMLKQVDPTRAGQALTADVTANFAAALARADVPEAERAALAEGFRRHWDRVNATDAARELIDHTILRPAVATIDRQFKDQPVVDAQLRQVLADRYLDLGLYDAAEPLLASALATRRKSLEPDHPDTLSSINSMGILRQKQGRPAEAERYYREAMERRRKVLGNAHPDTIDSIGWLGFLLDEQQRYAESEPLLREVLDTGRMVLGESNQRTLDAIATMGLSLMKQGKLADAEPLVREALEKRRSVRGPDDPDTLVSLSNLGDLLLSARRFSDAEPVLRDGLARSRRVQGESHPVTLSVMNSLGRTLQAVGKAAEAEALLHESLEGRRRVLGVDHPETQATLSTLAVLLRERGSLAEAEKLYREAVGAATRTYGGDSREVLAASNNLAVTLRSLGKLSEAEPLYLDVLNRSRRLLGEDHPETLKALNNLAVLLSSREKYVEAEPYAREAVDRRRRVLGSDHQETIISISNMGSLLRELGRLSEAEACYREAIERAHKVLGEDHPNTLIFSSSMGGVLVAEQKFKEAVDLLIPLEPKVRKAFQGGNAFRLATLLTDLGASRAALATDTGQFRLAEKTLLEAHSILSKTRGPSPRGIRNCLRAIVDLYDRWERAEPGQGNDARAAEWRAKLDPRAAATTRP